jgi:hypothetical protein
MENIDDFNRGVGLILGHLYQQFPIPCILHVQELESHFTPPTRQLAAGAFWRCDQLPTVNTYSDCLA